MEACVEQTPSSGNKDETAAASDEDMAPAAVKSDENHQETATSGKELNARSGSSRRKPVKTRKIVEETNEDVGDNGDPFLAMDIDIDRYLDDFDDNKDNEEVGGSIETESGIVESPADAQLSVEPKQAESSGSMNGGDIGVDIDAKGNVILPEGTVMVQPEDVDEKRTTYKAPEYKKPATNDAENVIVCTACSKQIHTNNINNLKRHPVLQVLICKRCYKWYMSDEIEQDEDGLDNQCRWCGEGGDLLCCDFCHNAFCKSCIRRNLGREHLDSILDAGEDVKWHCYVCDPSPLKPLHNACTQLIKSVELATRDKAKTGSTPPTQPRDFQLRVQLQTKQNDASNMKGKGQTARKSTTQSARSVGNRVQIQRPQQPQQMPKPMHLAPRGQMQPRMRQRGSNALAPSPVAMGAPQRGPASLQQFVRTQGGAVRPMNLQEAVRTMNPNQLAKYVVQQQQQKHAAALAAQQKAKQPQVKGQPQGSLQQAKTRPQQAAANQAASGSDIAINEFNVSPVLDRMFAAAQSMNMLLTSLKEELKKAARKAQNVTELEYAKTLVALKLKRAFVAYKKSFVDIENFAQNFQPVKKVGGSSTGGPTKRFQQHQPVVNHPQKQRMRVMGAVTKVPASKAASTSATTPVVGTRRQMHQRATTARTAAMLSNNAASVPKHSATVPSTSATAATAKSTPPKPATSSKVSPEVIDLIDSDEEAEASKRKRLKLDKEDVEKTDKEKEKEKKSGEEETTEEKPRDESAKPPLKLKISLHGSVNSVSVAKIQSSDGKGDGDVVVERSKDFIVSGVEDAEDEDSPDKMDVDEQNKAEDSPAPEDKEDEEKHEKKDGNSTNDCSSINDGNSSSEADTSLLPQLDEDKASETNLEAPDQGEEAVPTAEAQDVSDSQMLEETKDAESLQRELDEKVLGELEESIQSLSGHSLPSPPRLEPAIDDKDDIDVNAIAKNAVSDMIENSGDDAPELTGFSACELDDVNMAEVEALQSSWLDSKLSETDADPSCGDKRPSAVNGGLSISQLDGLFDDLEPSSSGGSTPDHVEVDAAASLQAFDEQLLNSFKYDAGDYAGNSDGEDDINLDESRDEDLQETSVNESLAVKEKGLFASHDTELVALDDSDSMMANSSDLMADTSGVAADTSGATDDIQLIGDDVNLITDDSHSNAADTDIITDETPSFIDDTQPITSDTQPILDDTQSITDETQPITDDSSDVVTDALPTTPSRRPPRASQDVVTTLDISFESEKGEDSKEFPLNDVMEEDYLPDASKSEPLDVCLKPDEHSDSGSSSDSLCFEKIEREYREKKQKKQAAKVCVVALENLGKVPESMKVDGIDKENFEAQRLLKAEVAKSSDEEESPLSVSSSSCESDYNPVKLAKNANQSKKKVSDKEKKAEKSKTQQQKHSKNQSSKKQKGSEDNSIPGSSKNNLCVIGDGKTDSQDEFKSNTAPTRRSKQGPRAREKTNKKEHSKDNTAGSRKSTRQAAAKKDRESDVDSDEQLEKDVDRLTNMSSLAVKKNKRSQGNEKTSNDSDESEAKKETKKGGRRIKVGKPRQRNILDGLGSSSSEEEAFPESEDEAEMTGHMVGDDDEMPQPFTDDEDARAKMELLASDDSAEEDSDIERMAREREAKAQLAGGGGVRSSEVMSDDSDFSGNKPSKSRKHDRFLTEKLSETDSDDMPKTRKSKRKKATQSDSSVSTGDSLRKTKGKKGKGKGKKKRQKGDSDSESDYSDDSESSTDKKKKRKRVKMMADSSDEEEDDEDASPEGKKRKKIRKIIKDKKLSEDSISAAKAEEERRQRIKERQKLYNQVLEEDPVSPTSCPVTKKLVLEMDDDGDTLIQLNPAVVRKLKPHQVEAVKFLWDCCCESLERLNSESGSGCILAHCMGLGKTLSVISFISTLMLNLDQTNISRCLVVCPLNTVLNWQNEFEKWLGDDSMDVYELSSVKNNWGRHDMLESWYQDGGIMIMGYELYRILSTHQRVKNKKQKASFTKCLVDPGPDIVVCDEGHVLKNDSSGMSKALNQIKTRRRIVLTGTPLQNNLVEYHCMVSFVKPGLLGTRKEFLNRFVNPITNGQCSDSTPRDVKVMKKRAHILHETLAGCVQRRDYSALTKFLPPKFEYVICVRLSALQIQLYEKYIKTFTAWGESGAPVSKGARLFTDYQNLMKIWTHPWVLKLDEIRQEQKRINKDSESDSFINDSDDSEGSFSLHSSDDQKARNMSDESSSDSGGRRYKPRRTTSRQKRSLGDKAGTSGMGGANANDSDSSRDKFGDVKKWRTRSRQANLGSDGEVSEEEVLSTEWWGDIMTKSDQFNIELSGKLCLLAEILKMAEAIGDKVLVFSQSLLSLDLIEDFLEHWDSEEDKAEEDADEVQAVPAQRQRWVQGLDYFRMDGSTNAQLRKNLSESFNQEDNTRGRLFLISTKAGSLGTNLVAANRVIVFDASWNPTHDVQSIFRTYRFGQNKPCYVYRFLAQGTMEEKIYERQVTKLSLSSRVIDEHQIERHFTSADLSELYKFKPDRLDDPDRIEEIPALPKDRMLAELLTNQKDSIVRYHEHDSLLENQIDQELSEEDRKAAWEEYEQEKKGLRPPPQYGGRAAMGPGYDYNMMLRQMMMSSQQQQQALMYQPPAPHFSMQTIMPDAQSVAQTIYAANPGMSTEELERRVQNFIQQRMYSEHHRLALEQQRRQQMSNEKRLQMEFEHYSQLKEMRRRQEESYKKLLSSAGSSDQEPSSTLRSMLNKP